MQKRVDIAVESDASVSLFIDETPVPLQNGTASAMVDANDEILLTWAVVGNPKDAYEIALDAEGGAKLSMMTGTNPTKSHIPQHRYTSGGFVRFKIVAALLLFLPLATGGAQSIERKRDQAAAGPASPLTSTGQVTIQASPKDGLAQLVVGFRNGTRLEFSTPLNKETDQADYLSLDGLATGTNVGLNYAKIRMKPRTRVATEGAPGERVCKRFLLPDSITCDAGKLEEYLSANKRANEIAEALEAFDDDFFGPGWFPGVSIKAKAAHEEFKFFEASGTQVSKAQVGASFAASLYLVRGANRISFGATAERAYKANDKMVQKCELISSGVLQSCESRPLDAPKASNELVVRGEWRRLGRTGLAPVVSWRVKEKVVGVDVPVFLVSNSEGQLTGGVRAGWRSDDKFQLAVFVTKPLGLF